MEERYNFAEVEKKWQKYWAKNNFLIGYVVMKLIMKMQPFWRLLIGLISQ